MTRDDIIRMGMEANLCGLDPCPGYINDLERFAALVAAAEREECAKLCEPAEDDEFYTGLQYADAIRARGTKWMNT
jgi:hypothetical protein